MKKRKLLLTGILTVMLFVLSACSGSVNYNTVEGSLYNQEAFSKEAIEQMSLILEKNILESWYVGGITPDNFEARMIDEIDDSIRGIYQSGYRSWYAAIGDIGFSSPETIATDISVKDVRYYINGDGILTVETMLQGSGENAHEAVLEYMVDRNKVPLSIGVNVQRSVTEKMKNAGLNTLLGMGMAFFVLILISIVISLFAIVSGSGKSRPAPKKNADMAETGAAIDKTIAQIKEREDAGTDAEIAAVITAAIAAYEADTGQRGGVVTGIRRRSGSSFELPQLPDYAPEDGVFIRPIRKREKTHWKKVI